MTTALHQERDQAMRECIDNCIDCSAICTESVQYGLGQGGEHAESDHVRLLLDCACSPRSAAPVPRSAAAAPTTAAASATTPS